MRSTIASYALLFLLLIIIISCTDDDKDPITAQLPVFSATLVNLKGPYDPSDSTFGDIKMVAPVIIPFGEYIDNYRRSPAIEYFTRPRAAVVAVTKGLVEVISENPPDQGDYEIHVRCLPGSDYFVIYDHVISLYVLENIIVEPGDTLGFAGNWNDIMRRTELQINNDAGDIVRAIVPCCMVTLPLLKIIENYWISIIN
jgi:hypothetical protein